MKLYFRILNRLFDMIRAFLCYLKFLIKVCLLVLRQNCTKVLEFLMVIIFLSLSPDEIVKPLFPVHFSFISSVVRAFGSI